MFAGPRELSLFFFCKKKNSLALNPCSSLSVRVCVWEGDYSPVTQVLTGNAILAWHIGQKVTPPPALPSLPSH